MVQVLIALALLASPVMLTPPDTATVGSSRLEWQTPSYSLYSPNPYRVQVDDDSAFSSINKDYYTSNNFYTPTLSLGNWYWRIKAKDSSGTWSDWSSAWTFILIEPTPTSTPTSTPSQSPTPSPTPAPTKTPSPTTTPKKTAVPTSTPSLSPTPIYTPNPTSKPEPKLNKTEINYRIASVAGVMTTASASATASSSATVEIKDQRQTNPLVWIGLVFVFAGVGTLGYIYIKKNAKLHLLFRR